MTEEMWLTTNKVASMIAFVRRWGRTADRNRRLRLVGAASLRAEWEKLADDRLRTAVAEAEEYADGEFGYELAERLQFDIASKFFHWLKTPEVERCHQLLHRQVADAVRSYSHIPVSNPLADIVRDIFGNPFRPVPFDKSWRTSSAIALAKSMYDAREFSGMPILADALQEAGCDDETILGHCRNPGTHVRGCWVVDAVLGKA